MNAGAPAPRRLPLARAAFLAYALVLLVATHWPRLRIEGPVERPDLWLHMLAFGFWTALLALSGLAGPRWSVRGVVASVGVGLAYAALDEASQAIPALGRTAALDDYLADAAGILLAGALLLVVSWRRDLRRRPAGDTTWRP